ncbi:HNH endonuclease signature motif containing protein [Caballeronia mineralivorans]|uniref:HNH endonuclease signature motif containing protein n=1 Tax=Caballeronia mineralivorans TaxID=2010198 RepID=UPI002AFECE6F|nr:HNH endonuclease signature motif containing protein [Caballeronia mineralivorans]
MVRRVDGGGNASRNLIMVHPSCHAQIHSLGLSVTKPALIRGFERLERSAGKTRTLRS